MRDEKPEHQHEDLTLSPAAVIGTVCELMIQSRQHRHFFLSDLEWLLLPPLNLGQIRLFRRQNVVVGYVSWALLSEEVAAQFVTRPMPRLAAYEWHSGEQVWIVDLITTTEHIQDIHREIKETMFPGKEVFSLRSVVKEGRVVGYSAGTL